MKPTNLVNHIILKRSSALLSICIPTYNRDDLLRRSLASSLCLRAPYEFDYEVIIVDNQPDSRTRLSALLLKAYPFSDNLASIRYYRNTSNLGMFGNWNQCLGLAEGKYLTILSDDDFLHSNFLQAFVQAITLLPSTEVFGFTSRLSRNIYDNPSSFDQPHLPHLPRIKEVSAYQVFQGSPYCGLLSVIIKTSLANSIQFSTCNSIGGAGDYLFLARLYLCSRLYIIYSEVSSYNIVNNASASPSAQAQFILGQHCVRTRLQGIIANRLGKHLFIILKRYHLRVSASFLYKNSPFAYRNLCRRLPSLPVNPRASGLIFLCNRILLKLSTLLLLSLIRLK